MGEGGSNLEGLIRKIRRGGRVLRGVILALLFCMTSFDFFGFFCLRLKGVLYFSFHTSFLLQGSLP